MRHCRASIARELLLDGRQLIVVVKVEQEVLRVVCVGSKVGHRAAWLGRGHIATARDVAVGEVLVIVMVLMVVVGHGRLVDMLKFEGKLLRGGVIGRIRGLRVMMIVLLVMVMRRRVYVLHKPPIGFGDG